MQYSVKDRKMGVSTIQPGLCSHLRKRKGAGTEIKVMAKQRHLNTM